MSSLFQDQQVPNSFFTRPLNESDFGGAAEESGTQRAQVMSEAEASSLLALEARLKRELQDLGLFRDMPPEQKKVAVKEEKDDEIVVALKKAQHELVDAVRIRLTSTHFPLRVSSLSNRCFLPCIDLSLCQRREGARRREHLLPILQARMKEQEEERERWASMKAREDAAKAKFVRLLSFFKLSPSLLTSDTHLTCHRPLLIPIQSEYKKRKAAERKDEQPRKKARPGSKAPSRSRAEPPPEEKPAEEEKPEGEGDENDEGHGDDNENGEEEVRPFPFCVSLTCFSG